MIVSTLRWYLHYEGFYFVEKAPIWSLFRLRRCVRRKRGRFRGKGRSLLSPCRGAPPFSPVLSQALCFHPPVPCLFSRPLLNRNPAVYAPHSGRFAPQTRPLAYAICTLAGRFSCCCASRPESPNVGVLPRRPRISQTEGKGADVGPTWRRRFESEKAAPKGGKGSVVGH